MAGLSSFIAVLLEKLHSVLELPALTKENKNSVLFLKKLGSALKSINEVTTDAHWRQVHDRSVKSWLEDLEDAVYDAEDMLDEILYEATRFELEAKSQNLKVLRAMGRWINRAFTEPNEKLMRSIKEIVKVIEAIAEEKDQFGFSEGEAHIELPFSEYQSDSLPVSKETAITRREEDRSNIVRLLLSGDEDVDVISLVGNEGVGKTTLAQLVYNDEKVSVHFELKAWVDVGFNFDIQRISRKILEAATFCSFEEYGLGEVQGELSASLAGKKFLLVLDDVRNALTISKWEALQSSLRSGARGSKVIVTTRSDKVAAIMGCSIHLHLYPLGVKDCFSILQNFAFVGRDKSEVETLKDIGRKIAKKCQGLPLVARTIGELLRFKKTRQEWLDVLEYLENMSSGSVFDIEQLSYYHLPAQLKRCFAYCSLFPKGYEFDKEEMVLLWMAEGFLQQSTAKSLEKVGAAECFNGLLMGSFFIPGDNSHFKMSDTMHFLAECVSKQVCFRLESRLSNTRMQSAIPRRTRHLSLLRGHYVNADNLSVMLKTKRLRTFCLINSTSSHGSCQLSPEALKVIFARQQRLRVLSLPDFQHAELPASIGELKYLRYLNVSDSALKRLPESLCKLYYLQTLILTNCSFLVMLPQGIVKLVYLRKLHIKGAGLKKMPEEMGRLKSLKSLSNFIVGHGGSSIKELGALPDLHGSLSVSMLQNVSSASDASAANLKAMHYLDELELEWSRNNEDSAADQQEVLENLKPSGELKKLSIRFYSGTVFPNWLGDSSSLNITSLHLGDCRKIVLLPPLGQLSLLEHLIVERFSGIKCIGHEFYGVDVSGCKPFQSLKTLKFRDMSGWEEWKLLVAEGQEFLRLEEFYIINCPVFRGDLPKSLPSLKKLEIAKCEKLEASLPRTSERCKVQRETEDDIPSKTDGEIASQVSSSMAQTSGNEIQLEWNVTKENPDESRAVQEELEPYGELEKPSIGSYGGTSEGRAVQEDLEPYEELEKRSIGSYSGTSEGRAVQEDLEPYEELEKPSIGSGDKEFLKWLEICSLSEITSLCISDINNFSSLPPLGQLPFLKSLIIQRIGGVRSIGPEFYTLGLPFRKPFQSLKTLKFEAMLQWERWTPVEVEGEEFPCLQEFYIINCPKLEGDLPRCLASLMKLEISECQQLAALLPWTSEHCVLKLENCDKVQKRSDDNQTVAPQSFPSMHPGQDDNQKEPSSSQDGNLQFSSSLSLNFSPQFSPGIMNPKQDGNQKEPSSSEDGNQQFSSSLSLNFSSIGMAQLMELPTDLQSLRIERYASDMLPNEILERSSLQHLYIIYSIPLKIFPLSLSLKTLYIHNCKSLEFPPPNKVMNQAMLLEDLCLGSSCDSLEIFPLNYFPKLKALSLWDCRNLECLSIEKELQTEPSSLDSLEIKDCPNLRSFLEEEFQAPNLTSLVFFNCGSLESLQRMQKFKSLQSLYINKCPALESLPKEGLPSSLVILCISFCDKITPQKKWNLDKLHSLSRFEIEGGCKNLKSFPEVGLLPINLNSLRISRLVNLTSLDREGLQKLTSLQTLEINCCNKLDSLPEHRLPSSLSSLSITDCSLLNPKLQNRKGKEWFKIAHIPSIHLNEVSD